MNFPPCAEAAGLGLRRQDALDRQQNVSWVNLSFPLNINDLVVRLRRHTLSRFHHTKDGIAVSVEKGVLGRPMMDSGRYLRYSAIHPTAAFLKPRTTAFSATFQAIFVSQKIILKFIPIMPLSNPINIVDW
jgi:hypothetical protein